MARQSGIIKLKGTIGDITFYKTSDGDLARLKGGIDANRMANDPAFQRTRENGSEFGRAGKGGKLIRNTMRVLLEQAKDKRLTSRLTKDLLAVVKTDAINDRGLRTIQDGDMSMLLGFEFNINGKLSATLHAVNTVAFDRVSGDASLSLAPFSPKKRIAAPRGTTHFKLVTGAAEIDFAAETFTFSDDETAVLPYNKAATALIDLTATVTANSVLPVFQVVGVEFYQEVNGQMYSLKNGTYNALAISIVDVV